MNSEVRLQRRTFLKAVAAGLAIPVALQFSRMVVAAPSRPKRLLLYFFPHGVPNEHMDVAPYLTVGNFADYGKHIDNGNPVAGRTQQPTVSHPDYVLATRSGYNLLDPLIPYRAQTSIVRGLFQAGKFDTHDSIKAILTTDGVTPSLDRSLASELKLASAFYGAVTSEYNSFDTNNGALVRDASDWIRPEVDAAAIVKRLFSGTSSPTPPVDENAFRQQTLALTMGEVTNLQKQVKQLTTVDNKLSAHLAALESIKSKSGGLGMPTGMACGTAPSYPELDALLASEPSNNNGRRYYNYKENFETLCKIQAELAAYTVLCGAASIVTVQNAWASADFTLPSAVLGNPTASHHNDISHKGYSGNFQAQDRIDFAQAQRFFMQRVARMAEILNQPDPFDAEHTALENTIIYAFSEIADGQFHGKQLGQLYWGGDPDRQIFQYYPAIIVGGGGGALKPGRLVTVDNRAIGDLLLTLAKAMGSTATKFGSNGVAPITELLA